MNARFFYAAPIFTNVPKLMVLTEDSVLYSEYKEIDKVKVEQISGVDYAGFNTKDCETEEYPVVLEIDYQEAREMPLNGQPNWIDRYLSKKNIKVNTTIQA